MRRLAVIAVMILSLFAVPPAALATAPPDDQTPVPTENDFFPQERDLTDCLGTLPKPNCGSDARGGWEQYAVMLALLAGVSFIGWRVVRGLRANERRRNTQPAPDETVDTTP